MLEAKYEVLITRNPAKSLSSSDQIFFNQISQLLDTNGKVRGYVRNKLAQPQLITISEPKSLTPSNVTYPIVISTKSHSSNPFSISTATNNSAATTILPQIVQPNYLPNTYPNPTNNSNSFSINNFSTIQTPQPSYDPNVIYPIASSTNSHFSNPLPPYIIRELPPIPTLSTSKPLTIHDSSPIQPQKSVLPTIPSIAFGAAAWKKHFGDVGVEPPLPQDIHQILSASCPFWPSKKVHETHLLVLVPQTVGGKPLTLKTLGELVKKPLAGLCNSVQGFLSWRVYRSSSPFFTLGALHP